MADPPTVYILLGTYNGARYLAQQLRSIQQQTFQDWRLLVRDDGSADETLRILTDVAQKDPRIENLTDNQGRLGVAGNFGQLLLATQKRDAHIILFADQDDVWLPDKITRQVTLLQQKQRLYGTHTPILAYSDLQVVDQNLNTLQDSFMRYQGIRHQADRPLNFLLAQNYVTGCALAINRALLEIAVPIPTEALVHDWWLALCAAVWGRIEYLDRPTVLYRQHGRNQVGAKRLATLLNPLNRPWRNYWRTGRRNFRGTFGQAAALREKIHSRKNDLPEGLIELVDTYARLLEINRLRRLALVHRLGIRRQRWVRQLLFMTSLLLEPRTGESSG